MSVEYNKEHPIPSPPITPDTKDFWEGIKRHELLFQRCKECGNWLHPPRPMCPKCRSLNNEWVSSTGKGIVYSWVTYHEAPHPGFKTPYSVVLVELDGGVRLVTNLVDVRPEDIYIGMPVEAVFENVTEELILPKFRRVA